MMETDSLSPRGASAWTGDAQGVYTVFNFENYVESNQGGLAGNLLDPTKHDNLTLTKARFYSRMSVRAHAGF
jgi:hypothetical protein